jgi:hypothetical protein
VLKLAPHFVCIDNVEADVNARKSVLIGVLLLCAGSAFAQSADRERAVIELGAAVSRTINDAAWSFGPTVAVEVTPIENWLELEVGVTPLFGSHTTEWDADFLFKKPWTLSEKVELMVGAGPEWIYTSERGVVTNAAGGEIVLDFMFWPSAKHKFGWYLEPGYDYSFGRGHEQSVGITGGLLIAIR